ncbi:MAG: winged helix-turn-helix transcriptional regulator [Euryarchaeota archaeon]|nr:winged helix-turn-helix transcriptional regulator [Euryarchaeota archaeon]
MTRKMPDFIQDEINKKGGLEKLLRTLPGPEEIERIAKIHHAMSDKTRVKILFFLHMQRSCVCLIHEITGLAYSKLSYHLKILKEAGLIECERIGNYMIYSLTPLGKKTMDDCMEISKAVKIK